jgi:hypothetical protein
MQAGFVYQSNLLSYNISAHFGAFENEFRENLVDTTTKMADYWLLSFRIHWFQYNRGWMTLPPKVVSRAVMQGCRCGFISDSNCQVKGW